MLPAAAVPVKLAQYGRPTSAPPRCTFSDDSSPRSGCSYWCWRQPIPAAALATRFSGRWSRSAFDKRLAMLKEAAEIHGFTLAGDPRFARYNPPWTLWFMRRNEVVWTVLD